MTHRCKRFLEVARIADNQPVSQHDLTLGGTGDVGIMRDQNHGDLISRVQFAEQTNHFFAGT